MAKYEVDCMTPNGALKGSVLVRFGGVPNGARLEPHTDNPRRQNQGEVDLERGTSVVHANAITPDGEKTQVTVNIEDLQSVLEVQNPKGKPISSENHTSKGNHAVGVGIGGNVGREK